MQIRICDICYHENRTLVELKSYQRVKGHPELRLDLCEAHSETYQPKTLVEHMQFVYKLDGIELDEHQARKMLSQR
ncbi:hypothetical protein Enr17x_03910 [Gimesia fumaroli]|uniref:Uncharacterized protein n=2 Tax=Gimesia TaxID=1649453 RepID=A0A517VEV6_9PLAN|nr:hypothetical protein Pan161_31650 [Gimesia algae]QDV48379.1 hypothetical protein Enr17x_03910 [Gimesia fumaroli]